MPLFDCHCHLQDERLMPVLEAVMARADAAGVQRLVCCGAAEADWADVERIAATHARVIPAYGLHPWYVSGRSPNWESALLERLRREPGAGVGEIGLDHALSDRNDADQIAVFRVQLEMARALGRPASIHCRRAWGALLECLQAFGVFEPGFLVHSYSGSAELIAPLVALGGYVSFSGSLTYAGNRRGRKAVAAVPGARLLTETDAPDIRPSPAPGEDPDAAAAPNEPAAIRRVVDTVAELRGEPPASVEAQAWANACRLFGTGEAA